MFLLFFLLIALGLLTILWIVFPVPGITPPDPLPPRPQSTLSEMAQPQAAPSTPAQEPASGTPAATTTESAPDPTRTAPGQGGIPVTAAAGAAAAPVTPSGEPASKPPAPIDLDELNRQLERLLGNAPPAPPASPAPPAPPAPSAR